MKLSAISSYLSQSEAAILVVLGEKIQRQAEESKKTAQEATPDWLESQRYQDAIEAIEAAYILRSVAEQSLMDNDGEVYGWVKTIKDNLKDWIDLDGIVEKEVK